MAVQLAAVDAAATADPLHVLRKKADALVHERDAIKERYDRALDRIADLELQHRYHLAIRCDHPGCEASASVSMSIEPPAGILAQQTLALAHAMRFVIGRETLSSMRALAAGRVVEFVGLMVSDRDLCSEHQK